LSVFGGEWRAIRARRKQRRNAANGGVRIFKPSSAGLEEITQKIRPSFLYLRAPRNDNNTDTFKEE